MYSEYPLKPRTWYIDKCFEMAIERAKRDFPMEKHGYLIYERGRYANAELLETLEGPIVRVVVGIVVGKRFPGYRYEFLYECIFRPSMEEFAEVKRIK